MKETIVLDQCAPWASIRSRCLICTFSSEDALSRFAHKICDYGEISIPEMKRLLGEDGMPGGVCSFGKDATLVIDRVPLDPITMPEF